MSKLNTRSPLNFVVTATCLVLCGPAAAVASNGYIDLVVTGMGNATKLEIESNDVKCGNDKNCIQTVKGQELDLDFKLKAACKEGGPDYRLSEMMFSMIQSQPESPGSDRRVNAFGSYVMPAIVTSDFGTDASGNVLWTDQNKLEDDKIKLKNLNEGEYVVFYQIKASKCKGSMAEGPEHIFLDPQVKNTGK